MYGKNFDSMVERVNKSILAVLDSMNHFSAAYRRTEEKSGFFEFALDAVYALYPETDSQNARRVAQVITHYYFS